MSATQRLHAVDALRGLAIVAILLLHNLEHFDVYHQPEGLPNWLQTLDGYVWDTLFFLFASKAYAIFALLFGLTFAIQLSHQQQRGGSFNGRFAWRMLLLLGFGLINSAFYHGDILGLYAMVGFLLIPLRYLKQPWLLALAAFLLLFPGELVTFFQHVSQAPMEIPDPVSWQYFGAANVYLQAESLPATIAGNLTNGKYAVLLWNHENGRYYVVLAMFLLGLVLGQRGRFINQPSNHAFWKKVLLVAVVGLPIFWLLNNGVAGWIDNQTAARAATTVTGVWKNLSIGTVLVAGFWLLFQGTSLRRIQEWFIPLGKMSLSNYVFQSILGTAIYYGWGLGVWEYSGATTSLLIGLVLVVLMQWFSRWWLARYKRGPLETLWHRATWL